MIQASLSPPQLYFSPATGRRHAAQRTRGIAIAVLLIGVLSACQDSIGERLDKAFELQESGQLELSILALQKINRDDPTNEQVNFLLGTSLVQSDRRKRAIPHLEEAAASDRYAIPAGLLLASTQYRIKAYEDAIQSSEQVLEIDSTNLTAIYTLGLSYLAADRPDDALKQAIRILEVKPGAQNAIILQGSALVHLHRAAEAEAIWLALRRQTAAAGNPNDSARACAELALFYQSQMNYSRAEEIYTGCLIDYPTHAYLHDSASDFYVMRSQPARAIAVHRQAVESSPENFQVWSRLAAIMYLHANPTMTRETYLEIVERFDSPEAWRLIADFYQKTRHTTAARKAIEEALIRSEQPPEAFLYSLAGLLIDEGNLDRAQKLSQRLKKPSYRHLLAGAIALAQDHPRQALKHFDAGLRLWPNNPEARYLAGRAALEIHDHARAIAAFGAAILVGSGATDGALRLAEIHFADGNFQSARGFAKHQIKHRPYLDPSPYHIAIRSALALKRPDDAKEVLNALRVLDPEGLAVVSEAIAIKRFEGGAEASSAFILSTGVDLTDPANVEILRAYANDLNTLARTEEALRRVDAALARNRTEANQKGTGAALHDLRARVTSQLGRTEEAMASANRALSIDSTYAPALETKAFLAADAGDLATALAALDAASAAEPRESKYLYSAASIAEEMGDEDGTAFRLEQTLARRPNHAMAANDLAWLLASDRSDLDRALDLAQRVVQQAPSSKTFATLGWVHHRRGDYDEAIKNYRRALETDATLPAVRYRLGLALAESGELSEAKKVLDELIRGPEFPELEAARIELARLQES
jgi:tetratricopeptide (TPR) repeat protein